MRASPCLPASVAIAALLGIAVKPALAQTGYAASHYAAQQAPAARGSLSTPSGTAALPITAFIRFDGRYAAAATCLPLPVQYAVNAANYLQRKPYVRGGGHRRLEDRAYDCSSAVSYALIKGGMLRSPLTSAGFANYGQAGPGRFITIWVKPGEHVFMTVCGLRLDTTGGREREGPRWRTAGRNIAGFFPRHPYGL